MLNDTSLSIVYLVLGILLGSVMPGFIGHLILLYKRLGFSLKMLWGFFRSLGLFLLLGLVVLLFIGVSVEIFGPPSVQEWSDLALGFGTLAGFIGGSTVLIVGILRARRRTG